MEVPNEIVRMLLEHLPHKNRVSVSRVCQVWRFLVSTFPQIPRSYVFSRKIGQKGSSEGEFAHPTSVAIDEAHHRFFVSDCDNHRIQVFDALTGAFLFKFGTKGSGEGQFSRPGRVSVNPINHEIFVADWDNHRIQVFDKDFKFLRSFGSYGTGNGNFFCPASTAINLENQNIYVADCMNNRVQAFN